jgi:hypothetical protein
MAKPERRNISCAPAPTVGLSAVGSTAGCWHDALLGRSCAPAPTVGLSAAGSTAGCWHDALLGRSCAPVPTVGLSAAGSTAGCWHDALLGSSCAPVPTVGLAAKASTDGRRRAALGDCSSTLARLWAWALSAAAFGAATGACADVAAGPTLGFSNTLCANQHLFQWQVWCLHRRAMRWPWPLHTQSPADLSHAGCTCSRPTGTHSTKLQCVMRLAPCAMRPVDPCCHGAIFC